MQNNQANFVQEDEIDLRELFITLWKKKFIIIIITITITLGALTYVFFKNPTPIYSGSILIEIGEVKSNNPNQIYFDNPYNLKNIIEKLYNVKVSVPKKKDNILPNSILTIVSEDIDKQAIEKNIQDIISFVIKRHQIKAKLYDSYIMTKQIGEIKVSDTPINMPKKRLIVVVAFITGFILSIFLVFFLQFISSFKEEKE